MNSYPVIVLGMHRSGTSMLANCLIRLGVNMGSNFLERDSGNPFGYWEDKDFLEINKRILSAAGGEWHFPTNRKALHKIKKDFRSEMSDLVLSRVKENKNSYWGWKDPRNSLTGWMWHEHLATHYPKYIVIRRNRQDVLRSLLRRNQDIVNWAQLAKVYSDHISAFITRDNPKVYVCHYEDFLKSQEKAFQEFTNIAKFLGMKIGNSTVWKAVDIIRRKK